MNAGKFTCSTLVIIQICAFILCSCITPKQVFPEDGVWYCEELQIQLSFEESIESYIVVNEEKIPCQAENDRGSNQIIIMSQAFEDDDYGLGETILIIWHIERNDNQWIVRDDLNHRYVFEKRE